MYDEVLSILVPELRNIFSERIDRIILYGSVARGTQTPESDVDIALIVRGYTEAMHEAMTDLTVELQLEYDMVLSLVLIDYDNFREWNEQLPFYRNVQKEGITLWQAA